MAYVNSEGVLNVETAKDPDQLQPGQLSKSFNMEFIGDNDLYVRRGFELYRDKSIFGNVRVIDSCTFKKRDDSFYYEIYFLADGKVFYVRSDAVDFNSTTPSLTEIRSPANTSPALGGAIDKVSYTKINNVLSVVFGSNEVYNFDASSNQFALTPDPSDFRVYFTVLDTVNAVINDVYTTGGATLLITKTKASGDGELVVEARQTGGTARPASSGTLTQTSGTGDASIAFTVISYSDTFEEIALYKRRAAIVSNEGNIFLSNSRNSKIFNGATSGFLEFDVIEGLKASNFVNFKRGAAITTEDIVTQRFSLHTLTGYRFYDPSIENSAQGQFKAERESEIHGMIGRSALEIGNTIIGLTRNGFISFGGAISSEFGLTDQESLSKPIRDQVELINFAQADKIKAVIDTVEQRYICIAPTFDSERANRIYVYEYGKTSKPQPPTWSTWHKWNLWTVAFEEIASIFTLINNVCISDYDGNVYKFSRSGNYKDNNVEYSSRIETGSYAQNTELIDKKFKSIALKLFAPVNKQEITKYVKLDRVAIQRKQDVIVEPKATGESLISSSVFIDSDVIIGSGSSSVFTVRTDHTAGNGASLIVGLTSTGKQWGLLSVMIEVEPDGKRKGN